MIFFEDSRKLREQGYEEKQNYKSENIYDGEFLRK